MKTIRVMQIIICGVFAAIASFAMGMELEPVVCKEKGFAVEGKDVLEINIRRLEPLAKIIDTMERKKSGLLANTEKMVGKQLEDIDKLERNLAELKADLKGDLQLQSRAKGLLDDKSQRVASKREETKSFIEAVLGKGSRLEGVNEPKGSSYRFALEGKGLHQTAVHLRELLMDFAKLYQMRTQVTSRKEQEVVEQAMEIVSMEINKLESLLDPCSASDGLTVYSAALLEYMSRHQELAVEVRGEKDAQVTQLQKYLLESYIPRLNDPRSWGLRDPHFARPAQAERQPGFSSSGTSI
ncbi:MAG: hypothetical protein H6624_03640 [Bdellovibrionaceae bacterium]|nr:hypothetical protein [Bdellovibrionales bacterium]MCB9083408.1 hypothetical protein [Pseudobdellovibrionaceae bacterium]